MKGNVIAANKENTVKPDLLPLFLFVVIRIEVAICNIYGENEISEMLTWKIKGGRN